MSALEIDSITPADRAPRVETAPRAAMLKRIFALVRRVLAILAQAGRPLAVGVFLATVAEAALALGSLYAIKLVVDAVSQATGGSVSSDRIFSALILVAALLILSAIAAATATYLRLKQNFAVRELIDEKIHTKAIDADLSFFESPAYYDSLQRARQGGAGRPAQLATNVLTLLRSGIMLTGTLVLLAAIEWRLLPILIVTVGAALWLRLSASRRMFDWRMKRAQEERRAGHLDWMLTSNVHAKEIRTANLGAYFSSLYAELRRGLKNEHLTLERRRARGEFLVTILSATTFCGAGVYLVNEALDGAVSFGDVVLFVLLLRRAEGSGNEAMAGAAQLVDDYLYLTPLFDFLDVKPSIVSKSAPATNIEKLNQTFVCQNGSFTYPGADRPSIRNLNLVLKPGAITALVGENGSGKTTLIKLLTRLYDPTEGRITLGGQDIRDFDPVQFRTLFSVIFQDFVAYPASVADNIRYGDVRLCDDAARVAAAARRAGADSFIKGLPAGYDTPLTKLFDGGQDLSVGQWQRIALSRAFFPKSQFVILDEPTSAVDPAAEADLFENFRERLEGRGALLISHRLSTVRQADYTYVLTGGVVVEEGTHASLMALNGAYAQIFLKQGKQYRHD